MKIKIHNYFNKKLFVPFPTIIIDYENGVIIAIGFLFWSIEFSKKK